MRLINTNTLELREFFDSEIPRYAILSHRWEEGEISFHAYSPDLVRDSTTSRGALKIRHFCEIASQDHDIDWGWVDTCCIDQKSSAELSEAINSMYGWYENAQVCLVYLSDVETLSSFKSSKWFTRGWTLQELLAPREMTFHDRIWQAIGTKEDLRAEIGQVTKIPLDVLDDPDGVFAASIAQRLSWAASRVTSRAEDVAYCLVGVCNVNMPLLYGEGSERAFLRLQKEILAQNADESIFAWWTPLGQEEEGGILAPHPSYFARSLAVVDSARFETIPDMDAPPRRNPHQITNLGLRHDAQLVGVPSLSAWEDVYDETRNFVFESGTLVFLMPIHAAVASRKVTVQPRTLVLRMRLIIQSSQYSSRELYRCGNPLTLTTPQWNAYQKILSEHTLLGHHECGSVIDGEQVFVPL